MEKKQNVPVLRFQGFSSEWNMKYFRDLVVLERGGSPRPIDHYITTDDNGLNWVKIGDAPANGNYITHTAEKIKPEGLSKTRQVFPGDLILSNSMSFGKPYIMGISGCIHDGWLLIRDDKHHFDLKYLCVLLGIPAMLRQYKALAAGSTVSNLNKELVGSTQIHMPDMGEQKEIGSFFEKLDRSIHWCKYKIQKLQQFRQTMLTKLFPREGAAEPELRFRGFSGEWRENKIADIAGSTYGGGTPSTLCREFWQGNIPWIQSSDILLDDIWRVVPHKHISKNALKEGNIRIIPKNSIAIVIRVGVGKLAFIPFSYTTSQDFLSLGNLCIDSAFATCAIKKKMEADILIVQGTSIKGVTKNEILNKTIMIPQSVLEQQKIGNFFKGLDFFIFLQQKKLERMQRLKAALLEKMFI